MSGCAERGPALERLRAGLGGAALVCLLGGPHPQLLPVKKVRVHSSS